MTSIFYVSLPLILGWRLLLFLPGIITKPDQKVQQIWKKKNGL
jgi:hypothetical protein